MASVAEWVKRCADAMEAAELCFGHGTDNAMDEAAWLVLWVLDLPRDGTFERWDRTVSGAEADRIESLLEARVDQRRPLAYLTGEAWFCGLRFTVDERVLVPRSPIAELIQARFHPWLKAREIRRALDLCTGSGCIAVAMAVHMPWLRVDAVDIDRAALALAGTNVAAHGVEERVRLIRSDLFAALAEERYELIVSNPPYVPAGAVATLPAEYRAEPLTGLAAGDEGLDVVLRILWAAPRYLAEGGLLCCEVGESAERLQDLLPGVAFTWLEFEHGGEGVFTISRELLQEARDAVGACRERSEDVR